MKSHPRFGIWLALFGAFVLTFDATLMRLSEMSGLQMTAWRGLCMGTVLILLWLVQGGRPHRDLHHLASGAGFAIVICQFFNSMLFCLAIAMAPVAVVLLGLAAVPVFAAIFAWLIIREPTALATWITIALVIVGIGIAVTGRAEETLDLDFSALIGALLGLGVAVALALNFVILRARPALPIPLLIGCGALLSGGVSVLVIGPDAMADGVILPMAATGLVVLPLSFISLSVASRHTHAANVSLLMLMETVLGPFWVWLFIGEEPTMRMILGGAIVILSLGAYLILTGRGPARKT